MGKCRVEVDTSEVDTRLRDWREIGNETGQDQAKGPNYDSQSEEDVANSPTEVLNCNRHINFLMLRLIISRNSLSTRDLTRVMLTYSFRSSSGARRISGANKTLLLTLVR
jgi:hypothetical protein